MKKINNLWHIYRPVDNDTRVILKSFSADSKKEAERIYNDFLTEKNCDRASAVLENRNVKWWRIYRRTAGKSANLSGSGKTIAVFKAKSRNEAYEYYRTYLKKERVKDASDYFYGSGWGILRQNKDGSYTDSHNGAFNYRTKKRADDGEEMKTWRNGYKAGKKESEEFYGKDLPYYVKTRHSRHEWYDIGYHVINDLLFNIPILAEKTSGCPSEFIEKAARKLSEKPDGNRQFSEKANSLGFKLWKEELLRFLNELRLYNYYSNFGIVDDGDDAMVAIDRKYRNTLPVYPGTNDFDYKKLGKMTAEKWDFVSNWMKKWLLACWD